MEAAGAINSAEKGASSETVEQFGDSALKPETVAWRTRRRKQRQSELAKKEKAAEAERIANAETQEEESVLTTQVPVVRRPTQAPAQPLGMAARKSTSSTANREEPCLIADEYPSQVLPTQDKELMGESPPLDLLPA